MPEQNRMPEPLPRKPYVSSWDDKWLFAIILAVGTAGMFVLWGLRVPQLFVTAWPVTCLLTYAAFLGFTRRYQVREDRAGDNLYYLGFLYTLISLGHALWVFSDIEQRADRIIVDFGIALATTILGLALRVIFNQLREDPIEAERTARLELNKTVSDLLDEMSAMRVAVSGYTGQIRQSIEEVLHESRKAIEENIKNSTEAYQKLVVDLSNQIKTSSSSLSSSTDQLTSHVNRASSSVEGLHAKIDQVDLESDLFERVLREAVGPLTTSAEEFRSKLSQIQLDPGMVERAINRPFERFSELLSEITERHAKETEIISTLSSTIDEANMSAKGIASSLDQLSNLKIPEDAITNAIEPAYRELNEYLTSLRAQSERDQSRLESLESTVTSFSSQVSGLDSAFASVLDVGTSISSMQSGFLDIAASIKTTTLEVSGVLERHTELVKMLNIDVQSTVDRLQNYRSEVDRELELVTQTNKQVFSQLAQLAETVVTRLEPDS